MSDNVKSELTPINDPDVLNDAIAQQNDRIAELETQVNLLQEMIDGLSGDLDHAETQIETKDAENAALVGALFDATVSFAGTNWDEAYRHLLKDVSPRAREIMATVRAWRRVRNGPMPVGPIQFLREAMDDILAEEEDK